MNSAEPHVLSRGRALLKVAASGGLLTVVAARDKAFARSAPSAVSCVLTPELTEGPYFVAGDKIRRNVAESRPGSKLTLNLTIVNAKTCTPIKGAAVDIWHCDAGGTYSEVQGNTAHFLRGIQLTNAKGVATFDTIYPGWYPGRTVHIHVKVSVGGNAIHTGQVFFADLQTDAVYRKAPYAGRGARDTRNSDDGIFQGGGSGTIAKLRARPTGGHLAAITLGVKV